MNKEEFVQLLDRYIAGEATSAQQQQLLNWYGSFQQEQGWSIDQLNALQQLEGKIWNNLQDKINAEKIADKTINASVEHRVIKFNFKWIAAASVLILLTAGIIYYNNTKLITAEKPLVAQQQQEFLPAGLCATLTLSDGRIIHLDDSAQGTIATENNISIRKLPGGAIKYYPANSSIQSNLEIPVNSMRTPRGGQYLLHLPDGTIAHLNAASEIIYPAAFTGSQRKVQINGEVYFEVAKNKSQPFIVETINNKIEVLGTEFNVNAYSDEAAVVTTLINGSVKINASVIKPGQEYINGKILNADIDKRLAWKNGLFNFEGADLQQVLRQLSRWYDVEIEYEGKIPDKKFGGEMDRHLVLSQVLDILKRAGIKYKMNGRKIIVGA